MSFSYMRMFLRIPLLVVIVAQLNGHPSSQHTTLPASFQPCGNGAICVPHYLCLDNKTINTGGENILDPRFAADPFPCEDVLFVCCNAEVIFAKLFNRQDMKLKSGCGHRNGKGVAGSQMACTGKDKSEFGAFPWMVMILEEDIVLDQNMSVYQCGGSLIHPSVVLTAAHCVAEKVASSLKIRAGDWECQTTNEIGADGYRYVQSVKIHERFRKGSLHNDVALLFLAGEPLKLTPNINTICLPPQDHTSDSQNCFVSGWGQNNHQRRYQRIMKKVQPSAGFYASCQVNIHTNDQKGPFFHLRNSFVCAGGVHQGKDNCKEDSGGPLVCPIKAGSQDRYYQTGLVTWNILGKSNNLPGVSIKVSRFRDWIDKQFAENGLDKKFYTA